MFRSSRGLYTHIACPALPRCRVPHCLFNHGQQHQTKQPGQAVAQRQFTNSASSADGSVYPGKGRVSRSLLIGQSGLNEHVSLTFKGSAKRVGPATESTVPSASPTKRTRQQVSVPLEPQKSAVATANLTAAEDEAKDSAAVYVLPVKSHPPALHSQRLQFATALAKALRDNKLSTTPNSAASAKELEIASRTTSATYANTMKQHISSLRKRRKSLEKIKASKTNKIPSERILEYIPQLVHQEWQLEENKYLTAFPSQKEIDEARAAGASGYEICDRCTRHFKVGADGQAECVHHWGKPYRVKGSDKKYSCCGEMEGMTAGCRTSPRHVFRITHYPRLAVMIPFRQATANGRNFPSAVALDCEMGYTTLGTELIRLTILEFPSNNVLYDSLVKPIGEVIDLNTQYSGVTSVEDPGIPTFDATMNTVLAKYIGAETILIGHGLENDLAVMRLYHKRVIDTSILFPFDNPELASRGYKRSLKSLAFSWLQRDIQGTSRSSTVTRFTTEEVIINEDASCTSTLPPSVVAPEKTTVKLEGHDSIEDAKAAADLVALRAKFMLALEDQKRAGATTELKVAT
ncbi:hypothetical protein V1517DRAFT_322010 [Lipomyces orientalis]|uniref:Uncharacterized protein n=1 Tax=Lipomyces orientalis TaxID=1233043 RepID=A0ACC3TPQ8_9ASCO